MDVAVFSTKSYDEKYLKEANAGHGHRLKFLEHRLTPETAVLAQGMPAVCAFVNDRLDAQVLQILHGNGTRFLALRSAGFNHVDLSEAERLGMTVSRVPAYSPHAIAEHTVGLILALNRRLHRAYNRVREGNFNLEGLLGFDLRQRTVGVIGTGKIGTEVVRILRGFGCRVLAYDPQPNETCQELGAEYTALEELYTASDIVTLHCPLVPATHHLIDAEAINRMRPGVMLINTSRGALVDTHAVVEALKTGKIGHVGLDVYEEEEHLFFRDLSDQVIQDDLFMRLISFPNVLVTGHQGFFTEEALENIAETTLANLSTMEAGEPCPNVVTAAAQA